MQVASRSQGDAGSLRCSRATQVLCLRSARARARGAFGFIGRRDLVLSLVRPEARKRSSTSAANLVMTMVPAIVRPPRAMPLGLSSQRHVLVPSHDARTQTASSVPAVASLEARRTACRKLTHLQDDLAVRSRVDSFSTIGELIDRRHLGGRKRGSDASAETCRDRSSEWSCRALVRIDMSTYSFWL